MVSRQLVGKDNLLLLGTCPRESFPVGRQEGEEMGETWVGEERERYSENSARKGVVLGKN